MGPGRDRGRLGIRTLDSLWRGPEFDAVLEQKMTKLSRCIVLWWLRPEENREAYVPWTRLWREFN